MKKIKLLLLLSLLVVSNLTFSQNVITWYRIMGESTLPTFDPTLTTNVVRFGYYNVNPNVQSDQAVWFPGATNWQAANWFGSGGGSTTINYNIQVAGGACSSAVLELSPELFGAVHSPLTFGQSGAPPLANYPNIGAVNGDYVDWAAWQMAVKLASTVGGAVKAKGPEYWINKPIFVEKFANDFLIDGSYCQITFPAGNTAPLSPPIPYFARKYNGVTNGIPGDWNAPVATKLNASLTNQSEAQQMATVGFTIKNFKIQSRTITTGQPYLISNKAFDLGPSTNAYYLNISTNGLRGAIHLRFATKTLIENILCDLIESVNGVYVDYGHWNGATPINSPSNQTTIVSSRFTAHRTNACDQAPVGGILDENYIKIRGAYGTYIKDCVFEGAGAVNGIYFDYAGNVKARDLTIINSHYEPQCGATGVPFRFGGGNDINGALVNVSMYGGIVTIDKAFSQHPSYFVMVRPPNPPTPLNLSELPGASPYPTITIANVPWVRRCAIPAQFAGRFFMSLYPTSWNFINNDGGGVNGLFANVATDITGWFYTGNLPNGAPVQAAPQPCNAPGCGPNRYYYTSIPR